MSDTTTTLNPGSGGAVMDETSALQSDGVTTAVRPRVVIGGNTGWDGTTNDLCVPIKADPGASPNSLPVAIVGLVADARASYIDSELRMLSITTAGRLRVATAPEYVYMDLFGDTKSITTDPNRLTYCTSSPWD